MGSSSLAEDVEAAALEAAFSDALLFPLSIAVADADRVDPSSLPEAAEDVLASASEGVDLGGSFDLAAVGVRSDEAS